MACKRCKSERIVNVNGKTSDMFSMTYKGESKNGYVPNNLFFGEEQYGDYIEFDFCADCGQIVAKFPIAESKLKAAMKELDD